MNLRRFLPLIVRELRSKFSGEDSNFSFEYSDRQFLTIVIMTNYIRVDARFSGRETWRSLGRHNSVLSGRLRTLFLFRCRNYSRYEVSMIDYCRDEFNGAERSV